MSLSSILASSAAALFDDVDDKDDEVQALDADEKEVRAMLSYEIQKYKDFKRIGGKDIW